MKIQKMNGLMTLIMISIAFCAVVMPVQAAHPLKATDENINFLSNSPDAWAKYSASSDLLKYSNSGGLTAAGKGSINIVSLVRGVGTVKALKVGDGQCVAFVRAVSKDSSVASTEWIKGKKVSSDTPVGTAIATFSSTTNHYKAGHTAILGSTSSNVWDQNAVPPYKNAVGRHTLSTSGYNVVEIADTYIAAHFANTGDMTPVKEPKIATSSYRNQLESFRLDSPNYNIQYRAHVANIGWMPYVNKNQNAGTQYKGFAIEAFKIKLIGAPADTHAYYRAYYNNAWGPWVSDDAQAGTTGKGIPVKGMQVYIGTGSPSGLYSV